MGRDADGGGSLAMSEEGREARRRSRRAAAALALAVIALAVVGLKVGPEALADAWRGAVRLGRESLAEPPGRRMETEAPPPARPFDALAGMPEDLRTALTAEEAAAPQPFRFHLAVSPAEICAALAEEGLPNGGWKQEGEEWGCASDLVPIPGSAGVTAETPADGEAGPVPSTLFFAARGPAENRLAVLRFKLNLDDPTAEAAGRERLLDLLQSLSGPLAWSISDPVEQAVRRHTKLSTVDRGVSVEVHPENGPVRRLNVVLLLETVGGRLPSRRFEPLPPAP
jgi:hypothetical protein